MIESLGAGEGFAKLYQSLNNKYQIKFIKVQCALDKCLERFINRDSAEHISISANKVEEYNKIAAQVSYNDEEMRGRGRIVLNSKLLTQHSTIPLC
ncbi:hypothetical protein NSTC745_02521 [Nostoc sp. DSM 114161]|jgi:uridine kinase